MIFYLYIIIILKDISLISLQQFSSMLTFCQDCSFQWWSAILLVTVTLPRQQSLAFPLLLEWKPMDPVGLLSSASGLLPSRASMLWSHLTARVGFKPTAVRGKRVEVDLHNSIKKATRSIVLVTTAQVWKQTYRCVAISVSTISQHTFEQYWYHIGMCSITYIV